jgi:hypothetical protein
MKSAFFSALIIPLLLAASLLAKGVTSKITISDAGGGTSIDITDPDVLEAFNIWVGPGTFVGGVEGTEGFIIDWSSGIAAQKPKGLHRYEVLFYVGSNPAGDQLAYAVLYEHDPSSGQGFVYLPGNSHERYQLNTRSIYRGQGLEGNWFRATTTWQKVFDTLISPR